MPGGDGTGPAGMGPMTGRAAGFCAGYPVPGYMNPIPGWGFGRGFGRGRGWRGFYGAGWPGFYGGWAPPAYPGALGMAAPVGGPFAQADELGALKGQAKYFQDALAEINKRIQELEAKSEKG